MCSSPRRRRGADPRVKKNEIMKISLKIKNTRINTQLLKYPKQCDTLFCCSILHQYVPLPMPSIILPYPQIKKLYLTPNNNNRNAVSSSLPLIAHINTILPTPKNCLNHRLQPRVSEIINDDLYTFEFGGNNSRSISPHFLRTLAIRTYEDPK